MAYADLLISIQKICMLVTITYFASRTDAFARLMLQNTRPRDRLLSYLFFSCLSFAEVLLAPHNPLMDTRLVSATAAGLLGGLGLGAGVGLTTMAISVLHSPWSVLDSVPMLLAGLLGGFFFRYRPAFASKVLAGFLVGVLGHGLWLAVRMQRDYLIGSWDTVTVGYVIPMLLSGAGVALFLVIIGDVRAQRERIERSELAKAMRMANTALPRATAGLDETAAQHIATMVRDLTRLPAVAVVADGRLMAHAGEAAEYHMKSGMVPEVAMQAVADGGRHITEKRQTWCTHPDCPFGSAAAAPLSYRGTTVGSIVLYEAGSAKFRPEVLDLGAESAQFLLNYQMQTAEIAAQAQAVARAELKALQAQVHPHFLFNALNTLAGLCEINPAGAADLTVKLGEFFRSSFRSEREPITTVSEELATARSYLDIEMARFGDRLQIVEDADPETMNCSLPSFSLQPLVENSIVHGVSKKAGPGMVKIATRVKSGYLYCCVTDNGCGFDAASEPWRRNGSHALSMLVGRLERIYASDYRLIVHSREDRGTMVCIRIPTNTTQ